MTTATADARRLLAAIARDLTFSWHPEAEALFTRIDAAAWAAAAGSPAVFLARVDPAVLEEASADEAFAAELEQVAAAVEAERAGETWWGRAHGDERGFLVAYFSLEFGLHASLPIYAGGLGILAGDHLKSASQLGVPLVAVGLLYREGYFMQTLDEGGQAEVYSAHDPAELPLERARSPAGDELSITVELAGEPVRAAVWEARVGRVPLYLLDAGVDGNADWARRVTARLYGGDREERIRQEVLLAAGGLRALRALALEPTVFHLNEGHSAFLALERMAELVGADGASPAGARELVRGSTLFTTHTPVPAGNEVFDEELVRKYVGAAAERAGLAWDDVLALGRGAGAEAGFGLTPLALRTAARANGVSALHGDVARGMWAGLWPERARDDVPIEHVTNGVHPPTWIAPALAALLREHGVRPEAAPGEEGWEAAASVDPAVLWALHLGAKASLCRLLEPLVGCALDPEALTIGFARRFATYKRAGLVFSDPERLGALVSDSARPVQLVVAGKAHPADEAGKELVRRIAGLADAPGLSGRVVFAPGYDMRLAAALIAGVDVWLNTPLRPLEASGTSGMKAALNGVLNLSILDGWWAEGYDARIGWALAAPEADTAEARDAADAAELYRLLEEEVVPAYYERREDGLPVRWLEMMKAAVASVGAGFTSHRMVTEYCERFYLSLHRGSA